MSARLPVPALAVSLLALIGLAFGCGEPNPGGEGPQATLALAMPMAPLGLQYGEQVTLLLRYRRQGQAMAGITLSLHIDSDNTGATLSADRVITNDYGEASVRFTAGAAEAAFHVLCTAPLAADLVIDVAVSKYGFGSLDALIDATGVPGGVEVVRAALVSDTTCAALPPTPKLGPVQRQQQTSDRLAVLSFLKLLVRPYSLIGRVEDKNGRLIAYGCVDLPDDLLRTGLLATVPVPLSLVFPSPVGTYTLTQKLQTQPKTPMGMLWALLSCPSGLGQVLLDGILAAIPPADMDLAMRLSALRSDPDSSGCRIGTVKADDRLNALLVATTAGQALGPVAQDVAAMQQGLQLATELQVSVATELDILAVHTLDTATLSTGPRMATYSLATVPVPSASGLLLTQTGATLAVPMHALTLRLPALWRKALEELVLMPRGLTMTPQQLLESAVASAQSPGHLGCDAVENVLCTAVLPPCAGKLVTPCATASAGVGNNLTASLADAPADFDLWLGMSLTMSDPSGTLQAQTLDAGQVIGQTATSPPPGPGLLPFSGTATGTRVVP